MATSLEESERTDLNARQQKDRERLKRAYDFLTERYRGGHAFHLDELAVYAGWKPGTVRTYPSKQWEDILEKVGPRTYEIREAFERYSFEVFANLNSQKQAANKDPFKPLLPPNVERLVRKARESALAGVQIFNSPTFEFKTPSFLVHMVIAWSSLLHAIFEEREIDYWYKEPDGSHLIRNGHRVHWDLSRSIKCFFSEMPNEAVKKNLELFIELRNEVEHRFAPEFDLDFAAECQACLLNFERQLVESFGEYFSVGARVYVPLQLSRSSSTAKIAALRELHCDDYLALRERLNVFRASLTEEVYASQDYAFRVFLVPKPANRESSSDMTLEFLNPADIAAEDLSELQNKIALIKTKEVPIINQGYFKPSQVVAQVQAVEPKFRDHEHVLAWKAFKVRPPNGADPKDADPKYCRYDAPNKQYLYTSAWVDKLKKFCGNPNALSNLRTMV